MKIIAALFIFTILFTGPALAKGFSGGSRSGGGTRVSVPRSNPPKAPVNKPKIVDPVTKPVVRPIVRSTVKPVRQPSKPAPTVTRPMPTVYPIQQPVSYWNPFIPSFFMWYWLFGHNNGTTVNNYNVASPSATLTPKAK